jgi:hypothetical protein
MAQNSVMTMQQKAADLEENTSFSGKRTGAIS